MQQDHQLLDALRAIGLESNALRVYAALCELNQGTAALIAKRAGLKRTTVYSVLERLEELGLVSKEQRAGILGYVPTGPEAIVRMAEDRKRAADHSLSAAKELATFLRSRRRRDALIQPKVQIFEGQASINAMLRSQDSVWRESLMAGNRTWLGFQDDSFFRHYGEWVVEYWKKFSSSPDIVNERVFLFSNDSSVNTQLAQQVKRYVRGQRVIRPLPAGIRFSSGMWVVGDFVILTRTERRPHVVMVFRDSALAENLAGIFEFVWNSTDTTTGSDSKS